jgi:predicted nucleotidyltransferase
MEMVMSAVEELDISTAEQITQLCEQIVRAFHPQKVILFGSYAYGQPSLDSDVDLLVVMSFEGSSREQAAKIRSRIDTPVALDLLVRTPGQISERLAMGDFFMREIIEQGKVLYEANHP